MYSADLELQQGNDLLAQFASCQVVLKNSERIKTTCILSAIKRLLAQL